MTASPVSNRSPFKSLASSLAAVISLQTLWLATAIAQQPGIAVQLPTTSVFSIDTVVSVPDGGSISLGGNSGGAWSRTRSGSPFHPFGNQAWGGSRFATNASAHVQIISLDEMEAELLSQLPPERSLADYARPKPPLLTLSTDIAPTTNLASGTLRSGSIRNLSWAEVPPKGQNPAGSSPATHSSDQRSSTSRVGARFVEQTIDPNGSTEVQQKAEFMSRHMGRKKK